MKVKFVPQNVECEIKPGQSVLHAAQDNNIHIKSVCRGVPSCAECRVRVVEGEHNVMPPSAAELSLIGTAWFVDRRRLSCQLRCFGDITVDMTEQNEKLDAGSGKKPRGRYNKDELQESRAVLGNLMMSDEEPGGAAPVERIHAKGSGMIGTGAKAEGSSGAHAEADAHLEDEEIHSSDETDESDTDDADGDSDVESETDSGGGAESRGPRPSGALSEGGGPKKRRRRRGGRGRRGGGGGSGNGGGGGGSRGPGPTGGGQGPRSPGPGGGAGGGSGGPRRRGPPR